MKSKMSIVFAVVVVITIYLVVSTANWQPTDAARWGWLPGTFLGVVGGTWGGVAGSLAFRGRGRQPVMISGTLLCAACVGMLIGGVILVLSGRPWHIWYPALLAGFIGCAVFPNVLVNIHRRYQHSEARRLSAKDISSA